MGAFDTILRCTLGTAAFQASTYSISDKPVMQGTLEIERAIAVTIKGYIEGSTLADFQTKLAAMLAAVGLAGQSLIIYGIGGATEYQLLAPRCLDGGPHVTVEMAEPTSPLQREFTLTAEANVGLPTAPDDKNPGGVSDTRTISITRRADSIRTVEYSGDLRGPSVREYFDGRILDDVRAAYPWPNWVVTVRSQSNTTNDKLAYSVQVQETKDPLPSDVAGNALAVDGTASQRVERDERMRRLTTYSYDLVVSGDPFALLTAVRPGAIIIRESFEVTSISERRLRASFSILDGGNGNELMDWEQFVEYAPEGPVMRPIRFDGVATILVADTQPEYRLTVGGRAVGAGFYPKAPAIPYVQQFLLAERPRVRYSPLNQVERETTWSYSLVSVTALGDNEIVGLLANLGRPNAPSFVDKFGQ